MAFGDEENQTGQKSRPSRPCPVNPNRGRAPVRPVVLAVRPVWATPIALAWVALRLSSRGLLSREIRTRIGGRSTRRGRIRNAPVRRAALALACIVLLLVLSFLSARARGGGGRSTRRGIIRKAPVRRAVLASARLGLMLLLSFLSARALGLEGGGRNTRRGRIRNAPVPHARRIRKAPVGRAGNILKAL